MGGISFPDLRYRQRFGLSRQFAGNLYMGGDYFQIGCLNRWQQCLCFADGFLLVGGLQAYAFAFTLDLVTEIVIATFAGLVNCTCFKFDAV